MPSFRASLYLLMTTSLSVMLTRANPELADILIGFSPTNITLGTPFMMDVRANPKAFMVVGVNVIHPNGTARPMMGGHTRDFFSVIPNGTISGEIATSQFNPPEASYCSGSIIPGFVAILGYTPMVAGTYTVMPYVQYFFGANGYGEQDAINAMGPCLDAPMTVETVPMANFTLIVNPSSDGQTTLTSVPTDFDYAPILPSATSLASLVAEPTGDEFTYSFSSAFSGTESGGQPPSPTESTGGSGNTRKVGLPLTLFLCVMALGNIVILIP